MVHHSLDTDTSANEAKFEAEAVNPTTLVIRREVRPVDPQPSEPLVLKRIAGNLRECASCSKAIKSSVVGVESPDDQLYFFARFERYHFFDKGTNAWQLVTSMRHYHLNPMCTNASSKKTTDSSLILTGSLRELVKKRFQYNLDKGL